MGTCQLAPRILASGRKLGITGIGVQRKTVGSWLPLFDGLLSGCAETKLRNRRIPNGTYGGVRGQIANNLFAIFLLYYLKIHE